MKILITGSRGFIGKNLVASLNETDNTLYCFDSENTLADLKQFCKDCDFVYHLAGINRTNNKDDFYSGNASLIETVISYLKESNNIVPIVYTSSIQVELDNDYGKSKLQGEQILDNYVKEEQGSAYIFRLTNVFGKWSRPNYNSVIATWCYNISHGLDIQVNNEDTELNLVYIDDVVESMIELLDKTPVSGVVEYITDIYSYKTSLGTIKELIESFETSNELKYVPDIDSRFKQNLYSTYLSYKPVESMKYPLKMNIDERGSFTEFLKSDTQGQVSINVSKPGISKGNHWHHSKNEKFLAVKGSGVIRMRQIHSDIIHEFEVSENKFEVIDIPTGYTHQILNTGTEDLVVIIWVNEVFDPNNPDTFYKEV